MTAKTVLVIGCLCSFAAGFGLANLLREDVSPTSAETEHWKREAWLWMGIADRRGELAPVGKAGDQ